uniref:Uncharacterized protein n=1 Tax=Panagrolaimus superbus TaxID=310955 RepID=A0A914YQM2_9BILA
MNFMQVQMISSSGGNYGLSSRQQYYSRPTPTYGMESNEDEEPQQQEQEIARKPWPAWQHQQQYRQRQSQHHRRLVPFAVAPILSSASYEKSREIGYRMIPERVRSFLF